MITFKEKKSAVRGRVTILACLFSFAAVSVAVPAESPVPVYSSAAFSQINSGASPSRLFTTDLNIFSLDSSAKKITVWSKTVTGPQLRSFSGISDVGNNAGLKGYIFSAPYGLAKHPTQNIIAVADKGSAAQRIVFYSYTESAEAVVFTYIGTYSNPEMVPNPVDVAFYPDGGVAVCGNVYGGYGAYAIRLTGAYDALSPAGMIFYKSSSTATGLDVDPISGHVFIASASDHCVYEYDGFARIRTYGVPGTSGLAPGHLNGPGDISVWRPAGAAPKLAVADTLNNRIVLFNLVAGNSVFSTFGINGTWEGQFKNPNSIYCGTQISVADTSNRRIQLFDFDPLTLYPNQFLVSGANEIDESMVAANAISVMFYEPLTNDVIFNISGYLPGVFDGPATVTILAGETVADVALLTPNGPTNCTLTFTQSPAGTFTPTNVSFSVRNVAPTIHSASSDSTVVVLGEDVVFTGVATDPSAYDVLTYVWTFSDGSPPHFGDVVTNAFNAIGVVSVTLTVTDPDGGADLKQFYIRVEELESFPIVFTQITHETVSFQIPTAAKNNNFLVEIATALAPGMPDWISWLELPANNLNMGGSFTVISVTPPPESVAVVSTDEIGGMTTVTFDITSLHSTEPHVFFRVSLHDDPF